MPVTENVTFIGDASSRRYLVGSNRNKPRKVYAKKKIPLKQNKKKKQFIENTRSRNAKWPQECG
jgi:hypothetical protein